MNPVEEFLTSERRLQKEAGGGAARPIMSQLPLLAATAILPVLGLTATNAAYRAVKQTVTRSRDFKNMMEKNPEFADMDAETVKDLFSFLHDTAPSLAANPIVAGGYIRKMEYNKNYLDPTMAKDLVGAEAQIQKNRMTGAEPYLNAASKIIGGLNLDLSP